MALPVDFHFTPADLQDYVDDPRRFALRARLGLRWPALEGEAARETQARRDAQFHRLAHQAIVGLPAETLAESIGDARVAAWWIRFVGDHGALDGLPPVRAPEVTLSAPLGGRRLTAKYDLIAVEPGARVVAVDWKTSPRRPPRAALATRLQTVVSRWLLVRAGASLNGGFLAPEQVSLTYWFAEHPDAPERFDYDAAQYAADGVMLETIAAEIEGRAIENDADYDFRAYQSLVHTDDDDWLDFDGASTPGRGFRFDPVAEAEF